MVNAMQEALLVDGRLAIEGIGVFEVVNTKFGARVVYRPAPAIKQISEEHISDYQSRH